MLPPSLMFFLFFLTRLDITFSFWVQIRKSQIGQFATLAMHALYTNASNNLRPQWMATPLEEVCLAQLVIPKCHTCREWAVSLSNNHYKASRRCLSRLLPALWKRWASRKAFLASGSSLDNLGKKVNSTLRPGLMWNDFWLLPKQWCAERCNLFPDEYRWP